MRASLAAISPKGPDNCRDRPAIGPAKVPHPASNRHVAAVSQVFMALFLMWLAKSKVRPTRMCRARLSVLVSGGWKRRQQRRWSDPSERRCQT